MHIGSDFTYEKQFQFVALNVKDTLFWENKVIYLHIYQHLPEHSYSILSPHSLVTLTAPHSFFFSE